MDPLEQSTLTAAHTDRFMSRFVDFETVADPSAATAGDAAGDSPSGTDPAAAAAPAAGAQAGEAVPPAAATEQAPAAPSLDLSNPQVAELVQGLVDQRLGPLFQYLQSGDDPAGGQQQQQPAFDPSQVTLDPFEESFGTNLAGFLQAQQQQLLNQVGQMLGQVTQPLQQRLEAETAAEGNQRLQDMLAADISVRGDLHTKAKQQVLPLAERLFPDLAQRFGAGPRTAEMAVTQAAGMIRELVDEAGTAAVEAYKNQLGTIAGAPVEPGANGAVGAQGLQPIQARTISEGLSAVTSKYAPLLRGT